MKKKFTSFSEKVKNQQKVVMYELLPPPKDLSRKDLRRSFSLFSKMLHNYPVDAINIPEVREETRSGSRQGEEIIKLEPRTVCSYLQKHTDIDFIINRPIVYQPWKTQKKWFNSIHKKFGVKNIILVGGESSKVSYPGLSVTDAAVKITQEYPEVVLGGITIPTRRDESNRVLQKSLSGVTFFTTQIIYESFYIKKFLKDYWELCQKKEIEPKMIFLSFAPISNSADLKLLQWLGVNISKETLEVLTTGWFGMGWRSLQICQDTLEDILDFVSKQKIRIPLGLNIEHLNRHNLESSFILLERLCNVYTTPSFAERRSAVYV
jgi:5,10-methylenetetrahydrofolate reductase